MRILDAREDAHVENTRPVNSRFYGQWMSSISARDEDAQHLRGFSESARTASVFIHDAARVNSFLHFPENFRIGSMPDSSDVAMHLESFSLRLSPSARSGTADISGVGRLPESGESLTSFFAEIKAELSKERLTDMTAYGGRVNRVDRVKGYRISHRIEPTETVGVFISEGIVDGTLAKNEVHVHVQVEPLSSPAGETQGLISHPTAHR